MVSSRSAECAALMILGAAACTEIAPEQREQPRAIEDIDRGIEPSPPLPVEPPPPPLHVPRELYRSMLDSAAPDLVLDAPLTVIDTTALTIGGVPSDLFTKGYDYAIL